jgi:tight adherence protein C
MAFGYYGPEAYIKRRQRVLQGVYRGIFPDILDMMVVCVDAGLSLNAALERVGSEGSASSRELGMNFALMGAEMRAGRGTMEALQNFADRIGIDEAKSLALLIQQSLELGTDVSQALRTFSDEMRDKRASRAEEKAAALPAKLVIPMGAFIFPVILVVILTPILLKLARSFGAMS